MRRKEFLLLSILLLISLPTNFSLSFVTASPAVGSTTTTIYSVADAYVNSSSSNKNYSSVVSLYVSAISEKDFTYVMFNLSSIPSGANIISARFGLYLSGKGGEIYGLPADTIGVYYCSDSSWKEFEITWDNKPSFSSIPTNVKKLDYAYDHETPQRQKETGGHMDAVRFTPLFSGQLLTARYYMYDLSTYKSNTFKVHIMDEGRNDLIPPFYVTPTSKGWFDVDLSPYALSVKKGVDFYIGIEWIVDYNPDLGEDRTSPCGRSWYWNGTLWKQETTSDFMIRAVVHIEGL